LPVRWRITSYEGALTFRDGSEATTRSRWQRIDADSFHVTRQRREGKDWIDVLAVTYRRVR
jgi:hypothetical protein